MASTLALVARGMLIPSILCSRCGIAEESTDHVFVNCLWARSVWWNVFRWLKITTTYDDTSVNSLLEHVYAQVGSK
ncbi:putative reverse transcriptase zinc-binding domain-containing protein [Helianthus annuus]|nr:putative reverse transcriptase zinc-binding domain-containing protein [Helianthus annuus]